jgi:hypothetical protein
MCRGKRSRRTGWQEERSSTEVMTADSLADRLLRVVLLALSGSPAMLTFRRPQEARLYPMHSFEQG